MQAPLFAHKVHFEAIPHLSASAPLQLFWACYCSIGNVFFTNVNSGFSFDDRNRSGLSWWVLYFPVFQIKKRRGWKPFLALQHVCRSISSVYLLRFCRACWFWFSYMYLFPCSHKSETPFPLHLAFSFDTTMWSHRCAEKHFVVAFLSFKMRIMIHSLVFLYCLQPDKWILAPCLP